MPYDDEDLMKASYAVIKDYQKPVNYREIKELCDVVYKEYAVNTPSNFVLFFKDGIIFGEYWKYKATESERGLKFKVRDEKIQHVDVIPSHIYEKEEENALKVENMAKIPLYYLLNDIKNGLNWFYLVKFNRKAYWICRYPYTYEVGFDYQHQSVSIDDTII
ncbi:MAG: hypothetical protein FE044_02105 [Thermoplasmata archaeon]|nr:MAG: hypothetical protein FE044_02105 [Thermoplasmata archaeon]